MVILHSHLLSAMSCFPANLISQRDRTTPLILVVENDLAIRHQLTQILEERGYSSIIVDTGSSCLAELSQFRPDLILLGNLEDCKPLREQAPHTPILVMIHPEESDQIVEAFVAGATDCLIKPIRWEVLHYQMQRFITDSPCDRAQSPEYFQLEQKLEIVTLELQKKLHLERTAQQIIEQVRDALEESQIMETAVREIALALGAFCGYGTLFNSQKKYQFNVTSTLTSAKIHFTPEQENRLRDGKIVKFNYPDSQFSHKVGYACPLISRQGENLGYLGILITPEQVLGEIEQRLLTQVSRHCAAALILSRVHQQAQKKVEKLEQDLQEKDEFLNIVAHELRSPIANISFIAEMLEALFQQHPHLVSGENSHFSRKGLNYLHILQEECDREIALVNDLLDLQRLEVGKSSIQPDRIYLDYWLTNLIEPFAERMQQRQQQLSINLQPDLPPLICDPTSLERIITELLHNACKYTPPQENITIGVTATPTQIQIQISNTGVELPVAELQRIFDKFYRIPQCDRWKQGGTGLGLALVKKLIESLGGSIQVENLNQTLTFTLSFPLTSCPVN